MKFQNSWQPQPLQPQQPQYFPNYPYPDNRPILPIDYDSGEDYPVREIEGLHQRNFRRRFQVMGKKMILGLTILIFITILVFLSIFLYFRMLPGMAPPAEDIPAAGYNGAVASEHPTCSQIGVDVMKDGGNAVDSAIASALCIGVLNSFSSGIGGGGFMLIRSDRAENGYAFIDFRETAPAGSSEEMFVKDPMAAEIGGLAVAVPGEVRGFQTAYDLYGGGVAWSRLFQPSIKLAEEGFPVTKVMASRFKSSEKFLWNNPIFNETFIRDGKLLVEGDTMKRTRLAEALKIIAQDKADGFYGGAIAQDIVDTMQESNGIITSDDLKGYAVRNESNIVTGYYHGRKIITGDAPTSGPILISILNIIERYQLSLSGDTPLNMHRLVEAFKFGYAQRTELGDPEFVESIHARVLEIISKDEANRLRHKLTDNTTHSWEYYNPKFDTQIAPGTTHISVIDKNQTAVAITSTVNLSFGAKLMTKRFGIILNNEMDDFSTPNKTNAFGLQPSRNNFIKPHARPLSSTVPTMIENDGNVELVVGGSGGSFITTAVTQVILNILDFNMNIMTAIKKPRLHHQLLPDRVDVEKEYPHSVTNFLLALNHTVNFRGPIADVQAIQRFQDGLFHAGSDPRKDGEAKAY